MGEMQKECRWQRDPSNRPCYNLMPSPTPDNLMQCQSQISACAEASRMCRILALRRMSARIGALASARCGREMPTCRAPPRANMRHRWFLNSVSPRALPQHVHRPHRPSQEPRRQIPASITWTRALSALRGGADGVTAEVEHERRGARADTDIDHRLFSRLACRPAAQRSPVGAGRPPYLWTA